MGTSLYPNQLDNSTSIPVATDNVTPVNAEVVNRLRDPIIAVESELGVNPSGTYGTVRARLDALEAGGGGGGGGSPLEIQDNGSSVDTSVTTINFIGTTITNPSSGVVEVTVPTTTVTQVQETIPVLVPGQTSFTLSQVPIQASAVQMFLNGVKLEEGVEYSNTPLTTTVTYTGLILTAVSDIVEFWYLVDLGAVAPGSNLQVKDNGTSIESSTTSIDFTGKVSVTSTASGSVAVDFPDSRIRVYLDTANFSGAASGVDQTITWNGTSSKITSTNASLSGGTQLVPTKSGLFLVQGQLTIQPTVDSIDNIIITVVYNGSTNVHTVYDAGAVWSVGTNRSFNFNFPMELASSDTLEVKWQHNGSLLSATDLVFGDNLSWFSIVLV